MRIVVIGTGPSALAAVRQLLTSNLKLEIKVLDIGNISELKSPIGFKTHFGSTHMYDQELSQITHTGIKPVVWPSGSLGGFSRIWGAAIGQNPANNFETSIKITGPGWESKFATLSAKKLIKKYRRAKDHQWELMDHNMAVDPAKCVMCGDCLTGCPTEAIWFAGNEWKNLAGIDIQLNFRVISVKVVNDVVEVNSSTGEILTADWVFLAAGAISTSQILMRSELIPKSIQIKDTKTLFFPALRYPVKEGKSSFALSQLSARFVNKIEGNFYLQLYPDSRKISETLGMHKPIIAKIVKRFWRVLSPWIVTGVIYADEAKSPRLQLTMKDINSFELSKLSPSTVNKKFFKKQNLSRSLFKEFGILPMFMLGKRAEPGESYHFGAISEIIELNTISNITRINIVDSSALKHLSPGPVTNDVMDNAKFIVKQFLEINREIPD
jgi:ferredoxin